MIIGYLGNTFSNTYLGNVPPVIAPILKQNYTNLPRFCCYYSDAVEIDNDCDQGCCFDIDCAVACTCAGVVLSTTYLLLNTWSMISQLLHITSAVVLDYLVEFVLLLINLIVATIM